MNCPICNDWCGPGSAAIAKKRSARTAHELATKKADEGLADLAWEEVYAVYFPKIYKHEYERNLKFEREIELEASVKKNLNHPDVCGYHAENCGWYVDDTHGESMKGLRRWYANSKWPNPLKR
jgi:beta-glucanase (GH16 family)